MKLYWTSVENWLQSNAPLVIEPLNDGATQSDIEQLPLAGSNAAPY
jgi:cell wall assembly regulator SMI1